MTLAGAGSLLSVVIPLYNEIATIELLVNRLTTVP
jgi:hypothetical protein